MQTTKMSLANIQGKLSRTEMKNIMAGVRDASGCGSSCSGTCKIEGETKDGNCSPTTNGKCYCVLIY